MSDNPTSFLNADTHGSLRRLAHARRLPFGRFVCRRKMSTVDSHAVRRLGRVSSHLTSGVVQKVPRPNMRPGDESAGKVETSYFVQARPVSSHALPRRQPGQSAPTPAAAMVEIACHVDPKRERAVGMFRANSNLRPRRPCWRLTSPQLASKVPYMQHATCKPADRHRRCLH